LARGCGTPAASRGSAPALDERASEAGHPGRSVAHGQAVAGPPGAAAAATVAAQRASRRRGSATAAERPATLPQRAL